MRRLITVVVTLLLLASTTIVGVGCDQLENLPPVGAEDSGLYCQEHGVPEKFCTLCHPELGDRLLLCPEHGNIPEDICTLCHPEVEETHDLVMCPQGHGLPKHFCVECSKTSEQDPSA